jgi:hypothetical protein
MGFWEPLLLTTTNQLVKMSSTLNGNFIGSFRDSDFDNQIRTVNYMTLLRYIRDEDADDIYACLRPVCNNQNKVTEARKAKVVETLINILQSDPDAKIPNVCNCENLVEAVCCNAGYASVAAGYNSQTDIDSFFQ